MTLDARLRDMLDHHEIRDLLARYCHACDRGDEALMAACYTGADSWDDHGAVKASGPDYAAIMCQRVLDRTEAASHILGQSLIRLEGDTAAAETFFAAFFRIAGADGEPARINQLVGRFVDELERREGRWVIRRRTCVRDTSLTSTVTRDDYASFGFVEARRDGKDPGAAAIGLAHRG